MFKKAFNKGGKRVLSFVMAVALAASSLPTLPQFTAEAALGDVGTKPAHMGQTSYNILNAFGELNNNGTTYDSLYTGNSGNLDTNVYLTKGDMRSQYTKLYSDGYNFTMDQNFDKQEVKIAGGTGYNPVYSSSIYNLGNSIVVNTQNINGYGGNTTFSSAGSGSKTNYIGTLATKRADGTDCGYAIRLPDSLYNTGKYSKSDFLNKGGVSCKYENVGTYTDSTGKETNIDCLLEVQDYGVSNSYIFTGTQDKSGKTGEVRHDFALITESEYGSLTSAQKNVCKKISDPVYRTMKLSDGSVVPAYDAQNTNKCVYGVPAYYYTKATELGLWEKLNAIDKPGYGYNGHDYVRKSDYYSSKYGALLRFTSNKVGVDVEWVDWIKIKYTFYKSGTNQPISVKGQTVFKDIDNSQGVAFLEGSNVIKKVGAWTDQSTETTKDFLIRRFTFAVNGSPKYIGLFDHQYKTTESGAAYQDAWIGMAWKGSSFDAIYTFCGTRGSSKKDNPSNSRAPMSGGTIQNDLPGDNMSGNLIIRKYVNGSSINSETYKNNVSEIAGLIKYKVTDNHNKTFKVSYNSNTGEYTYDKNGSIETDKLAIHKRSSGVYEVKINNLPFPNKFNVTEIVADNAYGIQSKATRVSTAQTASDKWVDGTTDTIKNVLYTNVTYPEKKADGVSATQGSATAYATFDNPTYDCTLNIAKYVNGMRLSSANADKDEVIEKLMSQGGYNSINIWVKNSSGEYISVDSNGKYTGTTSSKRAPLSWKDNNGEPVITVIGLPRDKYTVVEAYNGRYISKTPTAYSTSYTNFVKPEKVYTSGANITLNGSNKTGYVAVNDESNAPARLVINKYVEKAGNSGKYVEASKENAPLTNENLKFYLQNSTGKYLIATENAKGNYKVDINNMFTNNKEDATPIYLDEKGSALITGFMTSVKLYAHEESDVDISTETVLLDEKTSSGQSGIPVFIVTYDSNGNEILTDAVDFTVSGEPNDTTIINVDNPAPTQVVINKYGVNTNGNYKATADNDEQLNATLSLAIKNTDTNEYVSFTKKGTEDGAYVFNGTTANAEYIKLASETDDDLLTSGSSLLIGLPDGNYQVEEKLEDRSTDLIPSTQKYRTTTVKFTVGGASDHKYTVDVINPVTVRDLEIIKIIKDIDGNTSVPTATVREDLIFTVKNSAGRYLRAVDGVYAGTSATEDADCQFKLGTDGKFTIKDVPRDEYTVNEKSTSDMSSVMKCDATAKITTENEGYYNEEGNVVGIKTNSGTVINDMYYGYVKIQKKTNTNKGLSGIKFVISGTSDAGVKVSTTVTTDKNGVAVSGPILVGTYTIAEDKSTIPAGYIDGKTIDEVVVKKGKVADAKSYDYWNYYTEVSLTKVNAARPNIKIDGAVFAVYKDVNGNGTYEADVDTLYDVLEDYKDGHLKSVGDGKYSMSGLEFGKYLIKEIVAPRSNIFKYVLDDTYYPITIDKDHLSAVVANSNHNFSEDFDRCKITLIKRIPLDEIDGNIWYQHGTPIFVLELEDDIGRVYRHSYAFTKDYVDAHTFTENGKKYVEMSYTWENMTPGAYTASEVKTSRYSLKDVINVEKGVYDSKGKVVNFTIKSNEEGKATFYNVKNTYKNLSHNSIAVNIFKK